MHIYWETIPLDRPISYDRVYYHSLFSLLTSSTGHILLLNHSAPSLSVPLRLPNGIEPIVSCLALSPSSSHSLFHLYTPTSLYQLAIDTTHLQVSQCLWLRQLEVEDKVIQVIQVTPASRLYVT